MSSVAVHSCFLGFWGPDDVCFNDWAHVLQEAATVLGTSDPAEYTFDEGEQGQRTDLKSQQLLSSASGEGES